jgi:hypothetical protein
MRCFCTAKTPELVEGSTLSASWTARRWRGAPRAHFLPGDIVLIEPILKSPAIVACGMGHGPFSCKAEGPINPGMVLVTKHRHHDLCGRQRTVLT